MLTVPLSLVVCLHACATVDHEKSTNDALAKAESLANAGRFEESVEHYKIAAKEASQIDNSLLLPRVLTSEARAALAQGQSATARDCAQQAADLLSQAIEQNSALYAKRELHEEHAKLLAVIGDAWMASRQPGKAAISYTQAADELDKECGDALQQAVLVEKLAEAKRKAGLSKEKGPLDSNW